MDPEIEYLSPAGQEWHRQEGESDAAFRAFQAFVRLDAPRKVVDAWRKYAPLRELDPEADVPKHFYQWSRDHNWRGRAQALDDHCWTLDIAARVASQRRVSRVLTEKADALVTAAVDKAIDGNVQLLRDLLDRLSGMGIARAKAQGDDSHSTTNYTQVNLDLESATMSDLIDLARILGPYIGES